MLRCQAPGVCLMYCDHSYERTMRGEVRVMRARRESGGSVEGGGHHGNPPTIACALVQRVHLLSSLMRARSIVRHRQRGCWAAQGALPRETRS